MVDRHAHAHVAQRVLHARDAGRLLAHRIELVVDGPHAIEDDDLVSRALLDTGDIMRRQLGGDVDLARQERRGAGGVVGDLAEGDLLDPDLAAPPVGIALQRDVVARHPFDELEGAGADGLAADLLDALFLGHLLDMRLVDDEDGTEMAYHRSERPCGLDLDGVRPGRLGACQLVHVEGDPGHRAERFPVAHPLDRVGHVLGGKVRAVVELHALADLEDPSVRRRVLPAFDQAELGIDLHVLVEGDQRVEQVRHHARLDDPVEGMRVKRQRIPGLPHHQRLGARPLRGDDQEGGQCHARQGLQPPT